MKEEGSENQISGTQSSDTEPASTSPALLKVKSSEASSQGLEPPATRAAAYPAAPAPACQPTVFTSSAFLLYPLLLSSLASLLVEFETSVRCTCVA